MTAPSHVTSEQLRQCSLDALIPQVFPGAQRSLERQGTGRYQWILPDGRKVNIHPTPTGDEFRFMNRPDWHKPGVSQKGAINFLIWACDWDFQQARNFLAEQTSTESLTVSRTRVAAQEKPSRLIHPRPLQPWHRNWMAVKKYLGQVRKIPEPILAEVFARRLCFAGSGYTAGYVAFPHHDTTHHVRGYTLRWMFPEAPKDKPVKWVSRGSRLQEGWFTLGHGSRAVILAESPIDALTLWSMAKYQGIASQVTVRSTAGQGGLCEAVLKGFPLVIVATDRDRAGESYAAWIQHQRSAHQIVRRIVPPGSYKDWNEAWIAGSERVRSSTLPQALHQPSLGR